MKNDNLEALATRTTIEDGIEKTKPPPSAFPWNETVLFESDGITPATQVEHPGMTLLDYFAGQAIVGLMSIQDRDLQVGKLSGSAYAYAAAMLRERQNWNHESGERIDSDESMRQGRHDMEEWN